MSNTYLPPAGQIEWIDGPATIKKFPLPTTSRKFPAGSPLWTNGSSGVEPALQQTGTATSSDAAMEVFNDLFCGIALEGRVPQQLASQARFATGGDASAYTMDASKPFISVVTKGIFRGPYQDSLNGVTALAAQHEIGEGVALDGFENTGTQGFYGPDGVLRAQDTNFYLYNNCVKIADTNDKDHIIGRLTRRHLVGETSLEFEVDVALLNAVAD